jgi:hypothetical protein
VQEVNIRLTGWRAVVVLVVLIGCVCVRLVTLRDAIADQDLKKLVESQLMIDCPRDGIARVIVESMQASYPLLDFYLPRDVVIRVEYLKEAGIGERQTIYYLFRQGVFGWQYRRKTTAMMYYSNFM